MNPDHAEAIAKIQLLRGDVAISVDLSWCILDDAALECLKGLPQLQELYLSHTEVTDAGLEHLKGLRQLQTLDLGGTNVTDAGLEHLKDLPLLQTLDLSGTEVTDAGLEHLKGLRQLQTLDLSGAKVTDAGLERLQAFRQLQELGLSGTEVTDAGLEHLRGLPELEGLCFWATGAGLKHLRGLPRLRELDLGGTKVTDAGLAHLKGLRQLQSLDLNGTEVTDAGLEHLKGLKQLRTLDLTLTRVKGPLDPTEWESQGPQFVGLDVGTVPRRAAGLDRGQANEQLRHETQARRQTGEQSLKEQQYLRYLLEVNENPPTSDDFADLCRWTEEKARLDEVGTALSPEEEKPEVERRLFHSQRPESLGILAGSIAHDLNNILAGIMGYADLAKVHLPSPDLVRNDIEVIRTAVGRAADLTRQMLAHSGKGNLIVEPVSLSGAVKDIREIVVIED